MKNKAKLSTLFLALSAVVLTGCDENQYTPVDTRDAEISKITLDKRIASLFYNDSADDKFNEEITLNPTVFPRKNCERKITWKSTNPSVATVDQNGKVKAVGEGFADIIVSNDDESVSASTHIVVNNMNGQKISYCNTRQDDIFAQQKSKSFVVPDVVTNYEVLTQTIEKNGVLTYKNVVYQTIMTSKENAFISLNVDEITYRCEDASPILSSISYVFYTTSQFETYIYKTSGNTKNYTSANQSEYIGKTRLDALLVVCDNFFTSGSGIFTENYENILMQNTSGFITGKTENEHYGRMESVGGQLAFDCAGNYNEVATDEDEKESYIPYGTKYVMRVYDRFVYENYLCSGKYVDQAAIYTVGTDSYVNRIVVDCYYKTGDELVYPNKDNYAKVDGIFDL